MLTGHAGIMHFSRSALPSLPLIVFAQSSLEHGLLSGLSLFFMLVLALATLVRRGHRRSHWH